MSKVVYIRPGGRLRRAMRERACFWVVRLSGGASEADLREIHAWLAENPAHVDALLDAAAMWDRASVLSELSEVFPLESYLQPRKPLLRSLAVAVLAAVVLLAVARLPFLDSLDAAWRHGQAAEIPLVHETRVGERRALTLADGSEVILNTDTLIEVAFDAGARDLSLHRGEAYFSVASDAARPFRVHAGGAIVEAVGTAFTVQRTLNEELEVTVTEGVVNFMRLRAPEPEEEPDAPLEGAPLAASAEPIPLSAGESLAVGAGDEAVRRQSMQPMELEGRLAWRHGMLLFQGDPLESVIAEVSRYTPMRFEIDEAVRKIPVLGYFRTGDIDGILRSMQETFDIVVERVNDDHVMLKARD